MSRRELAFRVLAVVLGVAVPLGLVEGVSAWLLERDKKLYKAELPDSVRALINEDDHHIPTVPDPYLSYRMQPGIVRERVQTNEYGLREGPIEPRPAPGVVRILFLGGSVAWGYTANSNDDTIPSYLEEELNRRGVETPELAGLHFEVLNGGVPGYVSWQEALDYALTGRRLQPSWVLLLDGTNDIASAILNARAGVPMRYLLTERAYLAVEPHPGEALWRWLMTGAQELRVVRAFDRLRPRPLESYRPAPPAEVASQLRDATSLLADVAERDGAHVVTVLQPMALLPDAKPLSELERQIVVEFEHRMPGRNDYTAQSYAAIRGALDVLAAERAPIYRWIDATDAFRDTPGDAFVDDCHLTPLGRRRLAERIARGLLPALVEVARNAPPAQ